jgi:hypothetical protein
MLSMKKRVQNQQPPLENHTSLLIAALNGERKGGAYRTRLLALVVFRLQWVEALSDGLSVDVKRFAGGKIVSRQYSAEFIRAEERLNRLLRRQIAIPDLRILPVVGPRLKDETFAWRLSWLPGAPRTKYPDEVRLLADAFAITIAGKIKHILKCQRCSRWMFARRPSVDRFCTAECRDLFHRTSDEGKARRRDWQRKNYNARKQLESGGVQKVKKNTRKRG